MSSWEYEALDAQGQKTQGRLEADSPKEARRWLQAKGLMALSLSPAGQSATPPRPSSKGLKDFLRGGTRAPRLSKDELSLWTRQLAGLVTSGMAVDRALAVMAQEEETESIQALLESLRQSIQEGNSLAEAMRSHPDTFDRMYLGVMEAGEASGQLGHVLERLAEGLESQQAIRNDILGAALYPMIVSAMSLFMIGFLLTYVVPQITTVLSDQKRQLPVLTAAMLHLSDGLRQGGVWLILALVLGIALLRRWLFRHPAARQAWHAWRLQAWAWGKLEKSHQGARLADILSMLIGAGVPMLKSLDIAADTLGNEALQEDVLTAKERVREGASLGAALASSGRFPGLLMQFIRLGEQTGQLPHMLERAATQLNAQVRRKAMKLSTWLEPVLILLMGLIVLLIVLSVMLPILELTSPIGAR